MTPEDVLSALTLTIQYAKKFEIAQVFQTEEEFLYYFMCPSIPGHMVTYVVEDPSNGNITDLFAFRLHKFSYLNSKIIKTATVSVIVSNKTPSRQLITDLLLCAKQEQVSLLKTQQFGLSIDNFQNLLIHDNQFEYWHINNYSYPEVDEEQCFVLYSSLRTRIRKCLSKTDFNTKISKEVLNEVFVNKDFQQTVAMAQKFRELVKEWKPKREVTFEVLASGTQDTTESGYASKVKPCAMLLTVLVLLTIAMVARLFAATAGAASRSEDATKIKLITKATFFAITKEITLAILISTIIGTIIRAMSKAILTPIVGFIVASLIGTITGTIAQPSSGVITGFMKVLPGGILGACLGGMLSTTKEIETEARGVVLPIVKIAFDAVGNTLIVVAVLPLVPNIFTAIINDPWIVIRNAIIQPTEAAKTLSLYVTISMIILIPYWGYIIFLQIINLMCTNPVYEDHHLSSKINRNVRSITDQVRWICSTCPFISEMEVMHCLSSVFRGTVDNMLLILQLYVYHLTVNT